MVAAVSRRAADTQLTIGLRLVTGAALSIPRPRSRSTRPIPTEDWTRGNAPAIPAVNEYRGRLSNRSMCIGAVIGIAQVATRHTSFGRARGGGKCGFRGCERPRESIGQLAR